MVMDVLTSQGCSLRCGSRHFEALRTRQLDTVGMQSRGAEELRSLRFLDLLADVTSKRISVKLNALQIPRISRGTAQVDDRRPWG